MELKIEYLPVDRLRPYERNARKHADRDVDAIAASIREFGFNDPIGVWGDGLIVEGHGRLLAAKKLGMETVPVLHLDHMTDEQRRAYALAHNKTAELSGWDFDVVAAEIKSISQIDMGEFGFNLDEPDWFQDRERNDKSKQDGNDEYNAFVEKFEIKKTTDDCYTPDNVYDAVADWVANEYGLNREQFVRPFYPGGDYQAFSYAEDAVVVDNPPFSILAEIVRWYVSKGIRFFLFAPMLTLFSADSPEVCHVCTNSDITFENGAKVAIGFKTNMEDGVAVRTAPSLTKAVALADKENTKKDENKLRYAYPANVITAAKVSGWSEYGVDFRVPRERLVKISALDAQKDKNLGIFGGGFLLSTAQAAQAAQAAGIDVEDINENGEVVWRLSEREKEIVAELDRGE